jgi:site-specific DNA recombinase
MKTAIYARVSSEDQMEGHTIDSQMTALRDFARLKGYEAVLEIKDEAVSGASFLKDRPGGRLLLEAIENHTIERILILCLDRLSRDALSTVLLIKNLAKLASPVVLESVQEGVQNGDANNVLGDELVMHVRALVAQEERRKFRERTMRGRREKRSQGLLVNPRADLFGYTYYPRNGNGTSGHYEVDEEQAEVVRYMFSRFVDGMSIRALTRDLTEGPYWPPRSCYGPKVYRDQPPAKAWAKSSIRRMLTQPAYVGRFYQGRWKVWAEEEEVSIGDLETRLPEKAKVHQTLLPEAEWDSFIEIPAIIDGDTWQRAQDRMVSDERVPTRGVFRRDYALRAKVRCGECGRLYQQTLSHGVLTWRCQGYDSLAQVRCRNRGITARKLEDAVYATLTTWLKNPRRLAQKYTQAKAGRPKSQATVSKDIAGVEAALRKNKQAQAKAVDLVVRGTITEEAFKQQQRRLEQEAKGYQERLGALQEELDTLQAADAVKEIAATMVGEAETRDALFRRYVKEVIITRDAIEAYGEIYVPGLGRKPLLSVKAAEARTASIIDEPGPEYGDTMESACIRQSNS